MPGYHFHFLTADKQRGGHVLDLELESGTLEWDALNQLDMVLPTDEAFLSADLDVHDAQAVKSVEALNSPPPAPPR